MKFILIGSIILFVATALAPCEPFGLRLNYGLSIFDKDSPEQLAIRFNTREECPQLQLLINKFMIVHCPTKQLSLRLRDSSSYKTFLHICSLTRQLQFDTETQYNLFDIDASRKIFKENIKIKIKNPHHREAEFRIIHLADWGPITVGEKREILQPILPSLVERVREGEVDCVILNGDIGYELDQNAEHHEETMRMIQTVASLVPIIVNRGNHEDHTTQSTIGSMFEEYFQLYDLSNNNATGVTLGSLFLAILDPANLLLPRNYHKFTQSSLLSSLETTKSLLQRAQKQEKNIVVLSHYPLVCAYPTTGHCIPDSEYGQFLPLYVNLKDVYSLVLRHRAPLVLSGHVHVYERTYPLIAGYRSFERSSKAEYHFNHSFFIQVVEGACGSNHGLEDSVKYNQEYTPSAFVASHQEFNTGFGVLKAGSNELKYQHFKVEKDKSAQLFDQFTIHLPNSTAETSSIQAVNQEL